MKLASHKLAWRHSLLREGVVVGGSFSSRRFRHQCLPRPSPNELASHKQVWVATQAILNPLRAELNEKGQSNDCPLFERQSICP